MSSDKKLPPAPVAQPTGEPVAYRHMHEGEWEYYDAPTGNDCAGCAPLYTAPPAAARVPLTDEQIYAGQDAREKRLGAIAFVQPAAYWFHAGARFSERAHGITSAGQEGGAA